MNLAIFDIDGTLTDSNAIDSECFIEAFERAFGLSAASSDWSVYRHHTDRGLVREFLRRAWSREPDEDAIGRHRTVFLSLLDNRMQFLEEIAGARDFVRAFSQRQWQIGLATGAWSRSARMKLERAGFPLDLALASCDTAESREEIVLQAIGDDRPDCVVVFGDGAWDARTAHNLGLPFVGVGNGQAAEALRTAGAQEIVPDFSDAESVLRAMERAAAALR